MSFLFSNRTSGKLDDQSLHQAKENLDKALDCLDRAFICSACTGDPHTQYMVFNLYWQVEDRVNSMSGKSFQFPMHFGKEESRVLPGAEEKAGSSWTRSDPEASCLT